MNGHQTVFACKALHDDLNLITNNGVRSSKCVLLCIPNKVQHLNLPILIAFSGLHQLNILLHCCTDLLFPPTFIVDSGSDDLAGCLGLLVFLQVTYGSSKIIK